MDAASYLNSQVDASSSSSGMDRLSKLPTELLQKIFDEAYNYPYGKQKPSAPLSRTLLPLFDRYVWHNVKITGVERLSKLCSALQSRSVVGRHCRVLSIVGIKPSFVPHDDLHRLFDNLPNLLALTVNDDSGQILDILLPPNRQAVFSWTPMIKRFVCLSRTQRADPYNPAYLASVARMTSVISLELLFKADKPANGPPILRTDTDTPCSVAPLDMLSVVVPDGIAADGLNLFVQGLTSVKKLVVRRYEDPSNLAKLLLGLPSPDRVEHLVLESQRPRGGLPIELGRLAALKRVTLRGRFGDLPRESYDLLRTLPLERIDVDKESDISGAELIALVSGPTKLASLKHLHLDNVEGEVGDYLRSEYDIEDYGVDCWWTLPKWTPAFLPRHCRDLLGEGGVTVDVEVSGTITSAWETEQEWDEAVDAFHERTGSYFGGSIFPLLFGALGSEDDERFDSEDDEE